MKLSECKIGELVVIQEHINMEDRLTPSRIRIKEIEKDKEFNNNIVILSGFIKGLTYNCMGETIVEVQTNVGDIRSCHITNLSTMAEWEKFYEQYQYYWHRRSEGGFIDVLIFGNFMFFPPEVKFKEYPIGLFVDMSTWTEPYFWEPSK